MTYRGSEDSRLAQEEPTFVSDKNDRKNAELQLREMITWTFLLEKNIIEQA